MTTEITKHTESATDYLLDQTKFGQITHFSDLMSQGSVMVPDHLQGKPADCMAVVIQALQWGMNPFAVAQKTHLVNGTLGYESQLVNAVISSSKAINGRFHYRYSDGWEKLAGKVEMKKIQKNGRNNSTYTVDQPTATWSKADEQGLWVEVGAVLSGESEITWGEPVYFANVLIRNSPLWVTNPRQQISYLALKYWARLYTPQVIMGVYDKEEVENFSQPVERDITPKQSDSLNAVFAKTPQKATGKPEPQKPTETIDDAVIADNTPPVDDLQLIRDHLSGDIDRITIIEAQEMFKAAQDTGQYTSDQLRPVYNLIQETAKQIKPE